VCEWVKLHYIRSKTESEIRLEKKKYTLRPGITDYMDRFFEEQENEVLTHRDGSSSPNMDCHIFV
jgi:hypothetical protein